jgi:signal transduction histidine kinase
MRARQQTRAGAVAPSLVPPTLHAMPEVGPTLAADGVARAFPFYLWLDDDLRLLAHGAALGQALPGLRRGDSLAEHFEVTRPRSGALLADWRGHGHRLCTLRSRGSPQVSLRGSAEWPSAGGLLLLVSPVLTAMEEVAALGLSITDFAAHDAANELLLLARSTQLSARDAQGLAQRLQARTQQLDAIVDLCEHGVAFANAQGEWRQVNAALLNLLGLQRDQVIGGRLDDLEVLLAERLAPGEDPTPVFCCPAATDPPPRVLTLRQPAHRVLRVTTRGSSGGGRAFYLYDITAETEVDRMKSEFLSTAAHELRTPMVSIFGFTELLLHRRVSAERTHDVLQTVHRQAGRLIDMVNELLDLARIEARRGKDLVFETCEVQTVINQAVAGLRLPKHTRIHVQSPAQPGLCIRVDAAKTHQALTNVLSNAVKYSPQGGRIEVRVVEGDLQGRPAVGLVVSDQGLGMTPEQLARVFERFYRADPSGNIPGTGLGMCLVKEVLELQGGRVVVDSQAGVGTVVTLWLPLAGAAAGQAPPSATATASADGDQTAAGPVQ